MARQAKKREAKDVVCKGSLVCESATRYSRLLKSLLFVSGSGTLGRSFVVRSSCFGVHVEGKASKMMICGVCLLQGSRP